MKNIDRLVAWGLALLLLAAPGCRENREKDAPSDGVRTILFKAGISDTKTAFGEASSAGVRPTLWTSHDSEVKISLNYGEAAAAGVHPSADFRSATFNLEMDPASASSPYTFYAVSPAAAVKTISPSRSAWNVKVAAFQTPVAGSVDEGAQILAAKSASFTAVPSEVSLHFSHVTAYGLLSIQNPNLGDAVVQAVELTCSIPIVGEFYYSCEDGTFTATGESSTLRITTSATDAVWFACAPVDVSGKTMSVSIITDKGVKTKEITFPANSTFKSGVIARIPVDMAGVGFTVSENVYTLVSNASSLAVGDEVLILRSDETYVLGTTQNTNNREAVAIPSGTVTDHTIKESALPAKAQVLTLKAGNASGKWAFYTGSSGYLANSSGTKNKLVTVTAVNANSSFTVSIASDGEATIVASDGDCCYLYFNMNASNGNPLFACYKEDSSGMDPVCLFRKSAGAPVATTADPVTENSAYGAYLSDDHREYAPGTDQYSREYNDGVLTFTIVDPATKEQLEITGYRRTMVKGDPVTVSLAHRRGLTTIKNGSFEMRVVQEDGSKVWLGDGTGKGFIIRK